MRNTEDYVPPRYPKGKLPSEKPGLIILRILECKIRLNIKVK